MDTSSIIAQENAELEMDETSVLRCLEPLTKNKRNFLTHPVINTFIMIKYNSYSWLFFLVFLFKFFYAFSITGLAFSSQLQEDAVETHEALDQQVNQTLLLTNITTKGIETTTEGIETEAFMKHASTFWFWFICAKVMTAALLLKEIIEMINLGFAWFSTHNLVQLFTIFSAFFFIILLATGSTVWWMKYLAAWTMFEQC